MLYSDCSVPCPSGCSPSNVCGICNGTSDVHGNTTDCTYGNVLGNVLVYAGGNRVTPVAETGVTGTFVIQNICGSSLDLYFEKYGYTSEELFYTYTTGENVEAKMCTNCTFFYLCFFKVKSLSLRYIFFC